MSGGAAWGAAVQSVPASAAIGVNAVAIVRATTFPQSSEATTPPFSVTGAYPGPDADAVATASVLAGRLSAALACRTLCDGTGLGDDPSLYWPASS